MAHDRLLFVNSFPDHASPAEAAYRREQFAIGRVSIRFQPEAMLINVMHISVMQMRVASSNMTGITSIIFPNTFHASVTMACHAIQPK
jgi:hypothetical protein